MNVLGGAENLFVGSDYIHGDRSAVIDVHLLTCERSDIDDKVTLKLTTENARRFYGL